MNDPSNKWWPWLACWMLLLHANASWAHGNFHELLARVNAVLRRSPERPQELSRIPFPGGEADLERCEVRHEDGTREELSQREMAVLKYLAANSGRAISREEILTRVWRLTVSAGATRTIDMHVANLRAKLRDDPTDPKVVLTVRGKGYMFKTPAPARP